LYLLHISHNIMLSSLTIDNFRSIQAANLNLGKITILTGANNSGKTSVLYALMVLKNIVMNPNQTLDSCFNLPFINLGGFEEVVCMKQKPKNIRLAFVLNSHTYYDTSLTLQNVYFLIDNSPNQGEGMHIIKATLPYSAQTFDKAEKEFSDSERIISSWNGFVGTAEATSIQGEVSYDAIQRAKIIQNQLNEPSEALRRTDMIPLGRTFTKPLFSPVPLQTNITNEDELATVLANDRDLEGLVAHYFEKITNKVFQVRHITGTALFHLQTRDRETGFITDLVNEGLGTNQLITLLAKSLRTDTRFICVDEPEVHLHPSMITRLVGAMIDMTKQENKQFLLSTHSEHLVVSALEAVRQGVIAPEDVKIYYVKKESKTTTFEEQAINGKGQIEGGLKSFYADELGQVQGFLGIDEVHA
jgi:predicted ATPase